VAGIPEKYKKEIQGMNQEELLNFLLKIDRKYKEEIENIHTPKMFEVDGITFVRNRLEFLEKLIETYSSIWKEIAKRYDELETEK
jgi:hypothetical protein